MKLTKLFKVFFEIEKGGVLLILCIVISILLVNSSIDEKYLSIWHPQLEALTIENWINEGLLLVFFFRMGIELKRRIYIGELSNTNNTIIDGLSAIVVIAVFYTTSLPFINLLVVLVVFGLLVLLNRLRINYLFIYSIGGIVMWYFMLHSDVHSTWKEISGMGFIAGIGFIMSVFIKLLAYNDSVLIRKSMISILLVSLTSEILGYPWLRLVLKQKAIKHCLSPKN